MHIKKLVLISTSLALLATCSPALAQTRIESALRPATVLVAEISPSALEQATTIPALQRQSKSLKALVELCGGESVLFTVEIPHSSQQAVVQIHLSAKTDGKQLNSVLNELNLPAARKVSGGYAVSLFDSWARDDKTSIEQSVADSRTDQFVKALSANEAAPIRAAVILPEYFARTLGEAMPTLPAMLGGGSTLDLLSGTRWLSASFAPDELQFQMIAGADSPESAATFASELPRILAAIAKSSEESGLKLPGLAQSFVDVLPGMLEIQNTGDTTTVTLANGAPNSAEALTELARRIMQPFDRGRVTKSLKQLALAFHNYESAWKSFPPRREARDEAGKPWLSWRVHILPFMDEMELYNEFHLDEPWDSEHNIKLLDRMPVVFAPGIFKDEELKAGHALVQAPVGDRTIAGQERAVTFGQITDGTSNTILLVVTTPDRAVPWTKPSDFEYRKDAPAEGLQLDDDGSFATAFADGSVQYLNSSLGDAIRAYYSMNGGEVVSR